MASENLLLFVMLTEQMEVLCLLIVKTVALIFILFTLVFLTTDSLHVRLSVLFCWNLQGF